MTTQHTPTPWKLEHEASDAFNIYGNDPFGLVALARVSKEGFDPVTAATNAQLIVRAVNSHQALVGALQALVQWMDASGLSHSKPVGVGTPLETKPFEFDVVTKARAALALAKGETTP